MTDRELEQESARLEADAARGRVVVYLPAEDPEAGEGPGAALGRTGAPTLARTAASACEG
jgi:hypothetical protein